MEKVNNTVKAYVQIITFLVLWGMLVLATSTYSSVDLLIAVKQIPKAITIYVVAGVLFTKWIWRWPILRGWLVKIPNLQGTWKGELKSDWIDPQTKKGIEAVPVFLVIRQTFSSIRCTLMTKESTSHSTSADINIMYGGEDLYLVYTYTNRSMATIRNRSPIHEGASILKIIKDPKRILKGDYWTSRKSLGDIEVTFVSSKLIESFPNQNG